MSGGSSPFEIISAIGYTKDVNDYPEEVVEDIYNHFLINRTLSYHADCLVYANEMNQRHQSDKWLQFHFYLNSLRPRKRFAKWEKANKVDDLDTVKLAYEYNNRKALQVIDLLSDEQINELKKDRKGGVVK
jgi:hypothetical protein